MDHILYGSAALVALTNPLAEMPFFMTATDGLTAYRRRIAAMKVAIGVAVVLAIAAIGGSRILDLFDVSFAAFRAAGGLVIILAGLEMLRGTGSGLTSVSRTADEEDHLWVPLVMPLLAGPASITATITLALEETTGAGIVPTGTLVAVLIAAGAVLLILLATATLTSVLSRRAIRIFERFSGMILVAIGFQMGMSGIQQFFLGGPA
ncbi:MAG: MarC family protein [Phycisphaerales bacterium]|nr:MarC family protein [Phycisphaerales bacterium]